MFIYLNLTTCRHLPYFHGITGQHCLLGVPACGAAGLSAASPRPFMLQGLRAFRCYPSRGHGNGAEGGNGWLLERFAGLAKVAIFTTNVDAENQTLINHKCVCGALNRHFCQTHVIASASFSVVVCTSNFTSCHLVFVVSLIEYSLNTFSHFCFTSFVIKSDSSFATCCFSFLPKERKLKLPAM